MTGFLTYGYISSSFADINQRGKQQFSNWKRHKSTLQWENLAKHMSLHFDRVHFM